MTDRGRFVRCLLIKLIELTKLVRSKDNDQRQKDWLEPLTYDKPA